MSSCQWWWLKPVKAILGQDIFNECDAWFCLLRKISRITNSNSKFKFKLNPWHPCTDLHDGALPLGVGSDGGEESAAASLDETENDGPDRFDDPRLRLRLGARAEVGRRVLLQKSECELLCIAAYVVGNRQGHDGYFFRFRKYFAFYLYNAFSTTKSKFKKVSKRQ